jgi:hypothetical protein
MVAGSYWLGYVLDNGWLLLIALIISFSLFILALLRLYIMDQAVVLRKDSLDLNGHRIPFERIIGVFQHMDQPLSSDYITIALRKEPCITVMVRPFSGQRITLLAFRHRIRSLTYEQAHPAVAKWANRIPRFIIALLIAVDTGVVIGWISGLFPFKPYHPYLLVMGNLYLYWRFSVIASRMRDP